jgi:hypothetical protein
MGNRPHWAHCVAHYGSDVPQFVGDYFGDQNRRCLLVAAAGFDPRSAAIAGILANTMRDRLKAVLIREERPDPDGSLVAHGDANEARLRGLISDSSVHRLKVLAADNAVIGGRAIVDLLAHVDLSTVTDVVFDFAI